MLLRNTYKTELTHCLWAALSGDEADAFPGLRGEKKDAKCVGRSEGAFPRQPEDSCRENAVHRYYCAVMMSSRT